MTTPVEAKRLGSSPAWLGGLITGVLEAMTPGAKGGPEGQAAAMTPVSGISGGDSRPSRGDDSDDNTRRLFGLRPVGGVELLKLSE
jgi:hypothetical protein